MFMKEGGSKLQELLTAEQPIYVQISEMIETDILRGIFLEEERVPSTNELAKLYTINPATAGKGINLLVDEGILYKKRGIGMFVSAGARQRIILRRKEAFADTYIKTMVEEAKRLGIDRDELIQLIREMK